MIIDRSPIRGNPEPSTRGEPCRAGNSGPSPVGNPATGDYPSYEEDFGPLDRRIRRLVRAVRWAGKGMLGAPRRLLVEVRWRLGDEVMAIPIYEALKAADPGLHLSVLCHFPDLLLGNPHVDQVNPEAPAPDRYVLLRGASPRVPRSQAYARSAGVAAPVTRPRLYYPEWTLPERFHLEPGDRPRAAVCTGASWEAKRWPIGHWRELCGRLEAKGFEVIQVGRGDEPIGVGRSFVGQTTVREAACLLKACALFVGCDSGLLHLARAAEAPAVGLFGPTDPAILFPGGDPGLRVVSSPRDCRGCWNRPEGMTAPGACPLGDPTCMPAISVDRVWQEIEEMLHGAA